jgi:hypothetical protein
MKKISTFTILIFVSYFASAQNWSIGGEFNLDWNKWQNGQLGNSDGSISIGINFGRYFSEKASAGIKGSFGFDFGQKYSSIYRDSADYLTHGNDIKKGNVFSIGPYFQYDFIKYELFSFGFLGSVFYSRFNKSYKWDELFYDLDANRIALNASILIGFTPHKKIEFYMNILSVGYWFNWLILTDYYDMICTDENFKIALPLNNQSSLGIKFKF